MSGSEALRRIVGACLEQVLPNAADVAGGVGGAEHLHQLRIGLRRLRCALRVFGDGSPATDAAWAPALAALFKQLGAARDRDALAESVLPELQRAGAPLAELPPDADDNDPGEALRSPEANRLLLGLMGFAYGAAGAGADTSASEQARFDGLVRLRLRCMWRQLKGDATAFEAGDDAQRHRTRKRLKQLRYSLEFVAGLYSLRALKACFARLRNAQDTLGRYHDLVIAEQAFKAQTGTDARAWFAVGWLTAQREQCVPRAVKALSKLVEASRVLRERKALHRSP